MPQHSLPAQLRAGDSWAWSVVLDNYSAADGWVLDYTVLNAQQRYAFTATASGDAFAIAVAAATTASYSPGKYSWAARVSKAGEVITVASGVLQIAANLTSAADLRSHAQKTLDAIEAVIENRASLDQEEYAINGRSLKRTPITELIRLRDLYRREVRRESGDSRGKKLLVRM